MPSHTRRGAFGTTVGTTVGVGCVLRYLLARRILLLLSVNPRYAADCFVRVLFLGSLRGACVGLGSVGEMSCCCSTGCLSCRGKQSTSLSSSSSGRSLLLFLILFSILS